MPNLNKKTVAKYFIYLADYCEQLLVKKNLSEYDLEIFNRELTLFKEKIAASENIDSNFRMKISALYIDYNLIKKNSIKKELFKMISSAGTIEGGLIRHERKQDKMLDAIKKIRSELSHLQLAINIIEINE